MDIYITQTPMRITLAGGGTDVSWYSKLKGGAWISGAINKYVYIFINPTDDPNIIKIFDGSNYYIINNLDQIENPIVKECLKIAQIKKGLQITTISEVSGRSGLGGSGSFEVGLLNALHSFQNKKITQLELAKYAADLEIVKLKKPVGPQDQYISAIGGINYFETDKKGKVTVEPLKLSKKTLQTLERNLVYFSTGIQRDADAVLADQKKKSESSPDVSSKVIEALDKIKEIGQQAKEFLQKGEIDKFGATFHKHWLLKKSLSDKVSGTQIDDWYNHGMKKGALGGKIMGAGGGGWFVFYINKNHDKFKEEMQSLGLISQEVKFDWEGTKDLKSIK